MNDAEPHPDEDRSFKWHEGRVYSVTKSPNQNEWITTGQDGKVVVWGADTLSGMNVEIPADATEVAIARDGTVSVRLAGDSVLGLRPSAIASRGLARTFQNLALVPGLSVLENVMVGAHARSTGGFWSAALRFTPDGRHALVSNARSGDVAVFDVEGRQELRRIPMGLTAAETDCPASTVCTAARAGDGARVSPATARAMMGTSRKMATMIIAPVRKMTAIRIWIRVLIGTSRAKWYFLL